MKYSASDVVGTELLKVLVVCCLLSLLAVGCGGEREVGGECDRHADCNQRCLTGSEFPDGMCTVSCDDDYDCPSDASCVSRRDGVCLLMCDRDCPGGYECDSESRRGHGGRTDVCIGS